MSESKTSHGNIAIYFRNFVEQLDIHLQTTFSGQYLNIYPMIPMEYQENSQVLNWQGSVLPNNRFVFREKKYPYILLDGVSPNLIDLQINTGFCVAKEGLLDFLQDICSKLQVDENFSSDIISFWNLQLGQGPYILIHFLDNITATKIMQTSVGNASIQIQKIYLTFQISQHFIHLPAQDIQILPKTDLPIVYELGVFEI